MGVFNDLSNMKIGKLTPIKRAPNRGKKTFWVVKCDCGTVKEVSASSLTHRQSKYRISSCGCYQKMVTSERFKIHGMNGTTELAMYQNAKRRAKEKGLPFTLKISDIIIPATCPLLNIPLFKAGGILTSNSPSLDRKNSLLGYTKENTWVISYKANAAKSNCTLNELELLVKNLRNAAR
jgi:hypothetical protein